jgi:epsilon-lactone hydrolase
LPLPGGAALLCPIVDLSLSAFEVESEPDAEDPDRRTLVEVGRRLVDAYLAGHSNLDPLASPLRGDLSGLPPLLVQAATGDPLHGDARELHARPACRLPWAPAARIGSAGAPGGLGGQPV